MAKPLVTSEVSTDPDNNTETIIDVIKNRIAVNGPLSFYEYMDMALYYPDLGYYNSEGEKIGKYGDFYTSPCYTSLFGKMIARQIEEMWEILQRQPFTIVEYGAGTGMLCADILSNLEHNTELYGQLNYCIIERSASMKAKEKKMLPALVTWYDHIREIPPFTGCVLSNELLDNFAVHQVVMEDVLKEVFVEYQDGFNEVLLPAHPGLSEYFDILRVKLPQGFRTEVNLEAIRWIRDISEVMEKGFVLTIDYGYPSDVLYRDTKSEGTLVCYHKHQMNFSPYINIGEQDITTHVNFSALDHWGKDSGLTTTGFTSQTYFLLALGLTSCVEDQPAGLGSTNLIHSFLYDMGTKLKVLIQHKGLDSPKLSGLKFEQRL